MATSEAQRHYFQTNDGGTLYYETLGEGEAILFIHGFSLDHCMWQPQVAYFSKSYRVVTYDARGFGDSSRPHGRYAPYQDAKSLLDHLGIEKAQIVGLSMGGGIATEFALAYPDAVLSLTLIDSDLDGYASEVDWTVYHEGETIEQAKENWLHHELFVGTKHPESKALLRKIIHNYSGWHWRNKDERSHLHPRARQQLSKITKPTLILVGQRDLVYFHRIAAVLHAGIPNSTLTIIGNAGHMVNVEAAQQCNQLLSDHFHVVKNH